MLYEYLYTFVPGVLSLVGGRGPFRYVFPGATSKLFSPDFEFLIEFTNQSPVFGE